MRVELICIGSELLTDKINTNTNHIGEKLSSLGLGLSCVQTVPDDIVEIRNAFVSSLNRSDIVIATGGLGPTFDDLTREGLSKALNKRLLLSKRALGHIVNYFEAKGIEMPKNNDRQAYLIEGAKIVPNKLGTAPGQYIETEFTGMENKESNKIIVLLPGPPKEMQQMFDTEVMEHLKRYEKGFLKSFTLHICGMGESLVDEKIRPIIETERKLESESVSFAILAHQMIIDVKANVQGNDEMILDETIHNLKLEFKEVLQENIYGEDKETLESVVGNLLAKNGRTLSVAESCTGGLLSHRITNIPGSSMYFKEGVVTYSNESKIKNLNVRRETIEGFGAVSEETALEMVRGIKRISVSDYAISITGIAGPSGGTKEKPVGLVYIGLSTPKADKVFNFNFSGGRIDIRQRSANFALDILRRELLKEKHRK